MLGRILILRTMVVFILPYILLYSFYIQINGEESPGGGFQAGVIFASSLIGFDLIKQGVLAKYLSKNMLIYAATIGVLIYATTGLISIFVGDNYLNYYSLHSDKFAAQKIGIFTVEVGVGITVSAGMYMIYLLFDE